MTKIFTFLNCFFALLGYSQSKSTGDINLTSNMTANFTLNNTTSNVTLVLTGPDDRWFALGIGVEDGFGMSGGDVIIYTTTLSDRNFNGQKAPSIDSNQDWTIQNNEVVSGIRTLTLERSLTNSDSNDFQFPYNTTNTINLAWAKRSSGGTGINYHGGSNRGFASGTFTSLSVEDFSLNASSVYPNPASDVFFIKTKTNLSKVNLYNQIGALIKKMDVSSDSKEIQLDVKGIPSGVYFIELLNDSEKSWKKIIIE